MEGDGAARCSAAFGSPRLGQRGTGDDATQFRWNACDRGGGNTHRRSSSRRRIGMRVARRDNISRAGFGRRFPGGGEGVHISILGGKYVLLTRWRFAKVITPSSSAGTFRREAQAMRFCCGSHRRARPIPRSERWESASFISAEPEARRVLMQSRFFLPVKIHRGHQWLEL